MTTQPTMCAAIPSVDFEVVARRVVLDWAKAMADGKPRPASIEPLVLASNRHGDPRPGWLSRGFEAIHRQHLTWNPNNLADLSDRLEALRKTGFIRAIRLAEVAWATCAMIQPGAVQLDAAVALMLTHGDAFSDPRPPAERLWTDGLMSRLRLRQGRFDEALQHSLTARRLAELDRVDVLLEQAAQVRVAACLSIGDHDSALALMPDLLGRNAERLAPQYGEYYQFMLALLLAGRHQDVLQVTVQQPWVTAPATCIALPSLGWLLACVKAELGDVVGARQLLRPLQSMALRSSQGDNFWLLPRALLALGDAAQAHRLLLAQLQTIEERGSPLSPLDRRQACQALTLACAAAGVLHSTDDAAHRSCLAMAG